MACPWVGGLKMYEKGVCVGACFSVGVDFSAEFSKRGPVVWVRDFPWSVQTVFCVGVGFPNVGLRG